MNKLFLSVEKLNPDSFIVLAPTPFLHFHSSYWNNSTALFMTVPSFSFHKSKFLRSIKGVISVILHSTLPFLLSWCYAAIVWDSACKLYFLSVSAVSFRHLCWPRSHCLLGHRVILILSKLQLKMCKLACGFVLNLCWSCFSGLLAVKDYLSASKGNIKSKCGISWDFQLLTAVTLQNSRRQYSTVKYAQWILKGNGCFSIYLQQYSSRILVLLL